MDELKISIEILLAFANSLALIIGGYIAYLKFVKSKPLNVKVNVTHKVSCRKITDKYYLVDVTINIENVGNAVLKPFKGNTRIHQVLPLDAEFAERLFSDNEPLRGTKTEYDWPLLKQKDYPIEKRDLVILPGETERWYCDFTISSNIKTIKVLSFLYCDPKDEVSSWDAISYHDLQ